MTIKTLFLNALKAVIAPVIFFSFAASVSSITDLSELGKISARVISFYLMTTIIATIVAFTAYNIINPGIFNQLSYMISETQQVGAQDTVSILDTLIGIVPDNFLGAFVNSATLQLIFLGILVGSVVPLMGERTEKIASFISSANALFLKVASTITKCLPIAVFSFIGSMVMTMDFQLIKSTVYPWHRNLSCYQCIEFNRKNSGLNLNGFRFRPLLFVIIMILHNMIIISLVLNECQLADFSWLSSARVLVIFR